MRATKFVCGTFLKTTGIHTNVTAYNEVTKDLAALLDMTIKVLLLYHHNYY